MSETQPEEKPTTAGENGADDPRSQILQRELERRLEFFDAADDAVFGHFTSVDWAVCTILFFALPLLIVWLAL